MTVMPTTVSGLRLRKTLGRATWLVPSRFGFNGWLILVLLHEAAFGDGWAYQVFPPPAHHVNIHEHALHLWGRADGTAALPNFGEMGTI